MASTMLDMCARPLEAQRLDRNPVPRLPKGNDGAFDKATIENERGRDDRDETASNHAAAH